MTYRVFITGAGRDNIIAHMNQKPYKRGQPVTGDDTDLYGPYNTLANYIARAPHGGTVTSPAMPTRFAERRYLSCVPAPAAQSAAAITRTA